MLTHGEGQYGYEVPSRHFRGLAHQREGIVNRPVRFRDHVLSFDLSYRSSTSKFPFTSNLSLIV